MKKNLRKLIIGIVAGFLGGMIIYGLLLLTGLL